MRNKQFYQTIKGSIKLQLATLQIWNGFVTISDSLYKQLCHDGVIIANYPFQSIFFVLLFTNWIILIEFEMYNEKNNKTS